MCSVKILTLDDPTLNPTLNPALLPGFFPAARLVVPILAGIFLTVNLFSLLMTARQLWCQPMVYYQSLTGENVFLLSPSAARPITTTLRSHAVTLATLTVLLGWLVARGEMSWVFLALTALESGRCWWRYQTYGKYPNRRPSLLILCYVSFLGYFNSSDGF
jgi:hypothetical protein